MVETNGSLAFVTSVDDSATVIALRQEISRLMARVDEAVLIQSELRDQLKAREEEIRTLRNAGWSRWWWRLRGRELEAAPDPDHTAVALAPSKVQAV